MGSPPNPFLKLYLGNIGSGGDMGEVKCILGSHLQVYMSHFEGVPHCWTLMAECQATT